MHNIIIHMHLTGCGTLWVTDGIWKVNFPHCMYRVEVAMLFMLFVCWLIGHYIDRCWWNEHCITQCVHWISSSQESFLFGALQYVGEGSQQCCSNWPYRIYSVLSWTSKRYSLSGINVHSFRVAISSLDSDNVIPEIEAVEAVLQDLPLSTVPLERSVAASQGYTSYYFHWMAGADLGGLGDCNPPF